MIRFFDITWAVFVTIILVGSTYLVQRQADRIERLETAVRILCLQPQQMSGACSDIRVKL